MKIAISVESTNDLPKELLEKFDINVIPYEITLGDKNFYDGEVSIEEMFEYVDKNNTLPKTTAINEYRYTEYFEELRKKYDAVVHICLSSGVSSSCGNAIKAASNVENVYAVDSKSLTTGIGLLALYARDLANAGKEASEIAKLVEARASKLQVSFVVERLDYLYKGGRCSSLQLLGSNLLKIRPRIVLKDGKMGSDGRYRGEMARVVGKYCKETLDEFNAPDLERVFLTYTTASPEMVANAMAELKERGFKEIIEARAGATIASHCGGNTLGIIYFNDANN